MEASAWLLVRKMSKVNAFVAAAARVADCATIGVTDALQFTTCMQQSQSVREKSFKQQGRILACKCTNFHHYMPIKTML
jgi:hypothetical protein